VARGEEKRDSDIDIIVQMDDASSLLDLIDLKMKLEESLGKTVDLITYKSINPQLQKYIDKDKIDIL